MRHLDLFSGIGGFALAAQWAFGRDHEIVSFCEIDTFCQKILKKNFPNAPIANDIRELRGSDLGPVDLITGGFPCQPFSVAGKQRGKDDDRHLWPEMFRLIKECQPAWVLGENVAGIIGMELDQVLSDLEGAGYTTRPFVIPACSVNAPHRRDRVWIVAHDAKNPMRQRVRGGSQNSEQILGGEGTEIQIERPDSEVRTARHAYNNGSHEPENRKGDREGGDSYKAGENEVRKSEGSDPSRAGASDTSGGHDGQSIGEPQKRQIQQFGKCDEQSPDADPNGKGLEGWERNESIRHSGQSGGGRGHQGADWKENWFEVAAEFCGMDDGLPAELDGLKLSKSKHRAERLKSLGNAIVPQVAYNILKHFVN